MSVTGTFTYDPFLGDPLSHARALLLDTVNVPPPLFWDEAYTNMFAQYGTDEGTAQLALILLNQYGNRPTSASVEGQSVTWGDRLQAWQEVIKNARSFGMAADDPTADMSGPSRTRPGVYGRQPPDPYRARTIRSQRRVP